MMSAAMGSITGARQMTMTAISHIQGRPCGLVTHAHVLRLSFRPRRIWRGSVARRMPGGRFFVPATRRPSTTPIVSAKMETPAEALLTSPYDQAGMHDFSGMADAGRMGYPPSPLIGPWPRVFGCGAGVFKHQPFALLVCSIQGQEL